MPTPLDIPAVPPRDTWDQLSVSELLDCDWAHLSAYAGHARKRRMRDSLNFRFLPVVLIRRAHAWQKSGGLLARIASKLACMLLFLMFGLEYTARLSIGPGLVILHPQGSVLGAGSIGANVTIYQQVTMGSTVPDFVFDPALRPQVGDNVALTSGAKVIGGVKIGDDVIVGANAVVLQDVPANSLAVGVPARIISRDKSNDTAADT